MTLSTEMSDASGLAEETDIDVVGEGEDEDDEEEEEDDDVGPAAALTRSLVAAAAAAASSVSSSAALGTLHQGTALSSVENFTARISNC